ncbi:hypothetical protein DFH09DRAFT_1346954 [Mycena vulgaris]|nr:hypothetical protein DFH09DRAFT_1346954 [Mycena vulgaris]
MSLGTETLQKLCHDKQTLAEARRILLAVRAHTGTGSGFDLGRDRTGLAAVCAYLASQNLNNTNVTIEAAQAASCQSMPKFKKIRDQVARALSTRKPTHRSLLTYESLLQQHRPQISQRAVPLMERAKLLMLQRLDEGPDDDFSSDQEQICAVFTHVCNIIEVISDAESFEDYNLNPANMTYLSKVIKAACKSHIAAKIYSDYHAPPKRVPAVPRKPVKLRALPSRDPPQNPNPPSSRVNYALPTMQKAMPPSLVTLQSIRQTAGLASASKPHPVSSLLFNPQRSPSLLDQKLPARRRFRPVFLDQRQWNMGDPRLALIAKAGAAHHKIMVELYGPPFQQYESGVDGLLALD